MMSQPASPSGRPYYVTTPIYYVNDVPHLGTAYTTIAADVFARFQRLRGRRVHFLTGLDEHGQKIAEAAEAAGAEPRAFVDRMAAPFRDAWAALQATPDDFIRTTEPRHQRVVQALWSTIAERGDIYKGLYEDWYCTGCEGYYTEKDLVDGKCPVHDRPATKLRSESYFFRLSAYQDRLLAFYREHPDFVLPPTRMNEVVRFVEGGLRDLSISRSNFKWGIPVPGDADHVMYVWFDALTNYVSALGGEGAEAYRTWWPADVHLVGKDILRFHAVIWPAMLMAAGLPLPAQVYAHGWLLVGGEKMSKSKLTGISPDQIIDHFGVDAFRYYFLRAIQFGQDGSFSWEDMSARYTAELANGLGNLASRATAMVTKYFDGLLPAPGQAANADLALADELVARAQDADAAFGRLDFTTGIGAVRTFVDAVNLYVTEQQPWALAKKDDERSRERLASVLYATCESLRAIAVLHNAVMPRAMCTMWESIGAAQGMGPIGEQAIGDVARWGQLPPGVRVTKGAPLFPRLAEEVHVGA